MATRRTANEPANGPYDEERIETIWGELNQAWKKRTLPAPDDFPGLLRSGGKNPIRRIRKSLLDDQLGLGMQLRWNLALEALRGKAVPAPARTGVDARDEVLQACGFPAVFVQLGAIPGRDQAGYAYQLHDRTLSPFFLNILCRQLNAVFGAGYRKVSNRHAMTPALFQTPYFGDHATREFKHLLTTGEISRFSRSNRALMEGDRRYYPCDRRNAMEADLVARLTGMHDGQPIQCVVADGAPTAVEAFALHLADALPRAFKGKPGPRRDIYLVPCGRWVKPAADGGMEYLVQNLAEMLFHDRVAPTPSDWSEAQLRQQITALREELGRRPAIVIFVGHDALPGPLARLQEAVVDAPLTTLLTHLARPALGTEQEPYDPRHFPWTYFVVIGTAPVAALREYQQAPLQLPPIGLTDFEHVLNDAQFDHARELCAAMRLRTEAPTEAAICLFEQIRRMETIRQQRGDTFPVSDFGALTRYNGLSELASQFVKRLDDPQRRLQQAAVLIAAFAIGGVKRATLIRCLTLWKNVFPQLDVGALPQTIDAWNDFFAAWLRCFAPVIKSGADERWREIDPRLHPFEYSGTLLFNITCGHREWWDESIDFSIAGVRNAIVSHIQKTDWRLADGIHRIVAEEALRQHTMVLRHTFRSDRLTMRSARRGLQALFHGLMSLPNRIDASSHDEKIDPALQFNVSLPAQHLQRFRYLYDGLLPALLRDDTPGHFGTAWGAEAIKLELALFADEHRFRHAALTTGADAHARHYAGMALAAVRSGPDSDWAGVRARLLAYLDKAGMAGCDAALVDKVLLQMSVIELGPDAEETGARFAAMARTLGVPDDVVDVPEWQTPDGAAIDFPTAPALRRQVARQAAGFAAEPFARKAEISTLLFIAGMRGADAEEARLGDGRAVDASRRAASHLLACFAAMATGSQLMWEGYGEPHCPLPYLAAEGLRSIGRVGLEILRILQKNPPQTFLDTPEQVDELIVLVTSRVRQTLDDYARVFATNESERAHMLILEARFARLSSLRDPAWRTGDGALAMLAQPYLPDWPAAAEARRYELALTFLGEAEASLLNFQATDGQRIRLLSERCSTLRYLAINLVRHTHAEPALVDAAAMHQRARMACQLALLDVHQLKNIIERLAATPSVWLLSGARAKWSNTAAYHEAALQELDAVLAKLPVGGARPGRHLH